MILHVAAPSGTLVVTKTADTDDGFCDADCSLREAINVANVNGDTTTINFAIGSGQQTISPTSELPEITTSVIIDGTSQPGFSSTPIIELDGTNAGSPGKIGIRLTTSSSTIKGLVINRFSFAGIQIFGGSNLIQGNYIGTDVAGTAGLGNGLVGIFILGSNNTIGGTTAAARNLISGNGAVSFNPASPFRTLPAQSFRATISAPTWRAPAAIANSGEGITVTGSSSNTTIGGSAAGDGNLISGNTGDGVSAFNSGGGTSVQGNKIGTQVNGTSALGNTFAGVKFFTSNNSAGGSGANEGNIIAFNSEGVLVNNNATQNSIRRNSIFSNTNLGIDLGAFTLGDGVTANDVGDGDSGPNNRQNFPVITSAGVGATTVTGTLDSAAGSYTIDIYANTACDGSGNGEGETWLGSGTATGGVFSVTVPVLTAGQILTGTATDASGNTSEFSVCSHASTAARPLDRRRFPSRRQRARHDHDEFHGHPVR